MRPLPGSMGQNHTVYVPTHKTYSINQPIETHTRVATCQEVDCKHFRDGWTFDVAMLDPQLISIIRRSNKRYREVELNGHTYWVFPPEQQCFAEHRVSLERPAFFFVTPNSRSLNKRTARLHSNPDNWVDDFATHQERIKQERGQ